MSRPVPETAATASSSEPSAAAGWGATSKTATRTEVMNKTRVWAARELRLRDAASASPLTDSATNNRPVSARQRQQEPRRSRPTVRSCTPPDDLPDLGSDRSADSISDSPARRGAVNSATACSSLATTSCSSVWNVPPIARRPGQRTRAPGLSRRSDQLEDSGPDSASGCHRRSTDCATRRRRPVRKPQMPPVPGPHVDVPSDPSLVFMLSPDRARR
jgi:hypothetical protein